MRGVRLTLGAFFVVAGALHFMFTDFYMRMMPPIFPAPLFLIYLSGLAEIVLGVMALTGRQLELVRWGLTVLLLAVFPANIYMAAHPELFPEFSPGSLKLRLPFQLVFIAWVWFGTSDDSTATISG